jgi:hypothetical protein
MNDAKPQDEMQREFGPQPLDTILTERGLSNHELVAVSTEHLTHKMVAKGRKGRKLTRNVQKKIAAALNTFAAKDPEPRVYTLSHLFNYHGA